MAHGGRRPGAGRKADAGGPTAPLSIRVTEAERALWEDAAAAEGMSIRDWIRAACDERADTYTRSIVMNAKKQPTVDAWHLPPGNQGQMVEVSYGIDDNGQWWQRTVDKSGPTTSYRTFQPADPERWQPWTEEPEEAA